MTRDSVAVAHAFDRYLESFATLDPGAALRHLHVPFLLFDSSGVKVVSSQSQAHSFLATIMGALRSRGYQRSELTESYLRVMNDRTAVVSVCRVRYAADGREIERVGETYTLCDVEGEWKIAVAVVHEPAAVLRL